MMTKLYRDMAGNTLHVRNDPPNAEESAWLAEHPGAELIAQSKKAGVTFTPGAKGTNPTARGPKPAGGPKSSGNTVLKAVGLKALG